MRNILYIIIGIALLSSCSKNNEQDVAVRFDVAAQTETKSAPTVSGYSIRYIMEVYHRSDPSTPYLRMVQSNPQFDFRLPASNRYDFLFWADFIPDSQIDINDDVHYITANTLKAIKIGNDYQGGDVSRDAFCYALPNQEINASFNLPITLTRPFAKIEIISNTALSASQSVEIHYTVPFLNTYNVFTGEATTDNTPIQPTYPNTPDSGNEVAWDFLLVSQNRTDFTTAFTIKVGNGAEKSSGSVRIKTNTITKITGNF